MDDGPSLVAAAPKPEDRAAWRLYWNSKTVAERLSGMSELNRQARRLKGIEVDEEDWKWTVSKVRRQSAADELAGIPEVVTQINGR